MAGQWTDEQEGRFHAHKNLIWDVLAHYPRAVDIMDLRDDLYSYAQIGLWHAVMTFDAQRGMSFHNWAHRKITYAVKDGLRELDVLSRRGRGTVKLLSATSNDLAQRLQATPTWADLRDAGVDTDEAVRAATFALTEADIPEWGKHPTVPGPEDEVLAHETEQEMSALITRLPPKMALVIELMYYGQYSQKETGEIVGLTYSRISQIHKEALTLLHDMMGVVR